MNQEQLNQARQYMEGGQRDKARAVAQAALDENPDDILAWRVMARAAPTKDECQSALYRILALKPDDEWAQKALGHLSGLTHPHASLEPPRAAEPTRTAPKTSPQPITHPEAARPQRSRVKLAVLGLIAVGLCLIGCTIAASLTSDLWIGYLPARAPGIEGRCTRASLQAYLDTTDPLVVEFEDIFTTAAGTSRIALAPLVTDMQGARRECEREEAPGCAASYHSNRLTFMEQMIKGFQVFMGGYDFQSELDCAQMMLDALQYKETSDLQRAEFDYALIRYPEPLETVLVAAGRVERPDPSDFQPPPVPQVNGVDCPKYETAAYLIQASAIMLEAADELEWFSSTQVFVESEDFEDLAYQLEDLRRVADDIPPPPCAAMLDREMKIWLDETIRGLHMAAQGDPGAADVIDGTIEHAERMDAELSRLAESTGLEFTWTEE